MWIIIIGFIILGIIGHFFGEEEEKEVNKEIKPLNVYRDPYNINSEETKSGSFIKKEPYQNKVISYKDKNIYKKLKNTLNQTFILNDQELNFSCDIWNLEKITKLVEDIKNGLDTPESIYGRITELSNKDTLKSIPDKKIIGGELYNLANDATRRGDMETSLAHYLLALCIISEDLSCFNNICAILKKYNRKKLALYIYQRQLLNNKNDWMLAFRMTICSYELNKNDYTSLKTLIKEQELSTELLVKVMLEKYKEDSNIVFIIKKISEDLKKENAKQLSHVADFQFPNSSRIYKYIVNENFNDINSIGDTVSFIDYSGMTKEVIVKSKKYSLDINTLPYELKKIDIISKKEVVKKYNSNSQKKIDNRSLNVYKELSEHYFECMFGNYIVNNQSKFLHEDYFDEIEEYDEDKAMEDYIDFLYCGFLHQYSAYKEVKASEFYNIIFKTILDLTDKIYKECTYSNLFLDEIEEFKENFMIDREEHIASICHNNDYNINEIVEVFYWREKDLIENCSITKSFKENDMYSKKMAIAQLWTMFCCIEAIDDIKSGKR